MLEPEREQRESAYIDQISRMASRFYRNMSKNGFPSSHVCKLTQEFVRSYVVTDMQDPGYFDDEWSDDWTPGDGEEGEEA